LVSTLAWSKVGHGLKAWSTSAKDYKIDICYFLAQYAVLRKKGREWLAWKQDNVSEWSDMSTTWTFV